MCPYKIVTLGMRVSGVEDGEEGWEDKMANVYVPLPIKLNPCNRSNNMLRCLLFVYEITSELCVYVCV